jgi:hypothetical protein
MKQISLATQICYQVFCKIATYKLYEAQNYVCKSHKLCGIICQGLPWRQLFLSFFSFIPFFFQHAFRSGPLLQYLFLSFSFPDSL